MADYPIVNLVLVYSAVVMVVSFTVLAVAVAAAAAWGLFRPYRGRH